MAKYAKAFMAAVLAGLGAGMTAQGVDAAAVDSIIAGILAALGAFGGTWAIPNKTSLPTPPRPVG